MVGNSEDMYFLFVLLQLLVVVYVSVLPQRFVSDLL